ncbi:MAG: YbaB/EbfC family nucleoid-associated protein [Sulfurovaceae bacterium]|nr:YbaB/EbfC family nucleoid-associated protein [Sulfurovaceae bacterium]
MFDGLDMNKMGQMMEELQSKAKEMEEQSKKVMLTSKAGGGMIEVTANGGGEIVDITIDDSILDDKESLQILMISAINDVIKMVEDNKKSQAMGMMGGLNPFGMN